MIHYKNKYRDDRRFYKSTSLHEAGHIVGAWLCGQKVHLAVVRPVGGELRGGAQDIAGMVVHGTQAYAQGIPLQSLDKLRDGSNPRWVAAVNAVFVKGAGPAAQARADRRSAISVAVTGGSVDMMESVDLVKPFEPDPLAQFDLVVSIWKLSSLVIRASAVWPSVVYLAQQLEDAGGRMTASRLELLRETLLVGSIRTPLDLPITAIFKAEPVGADEEI